MQFMHVLNLSFTRIRILKGRQRRQTTDDEVYHEVFINPGENSKDLMQQFAATCTHENFIEAGLNITIQDEGYQSSVDGSVDLSQYIQ